MEWAVLKHHPELTYQVVKQLTYLEKHYKPGNWAAHQLKTDWGYDLDELNTDAGNQE